MPLARPTPVFNSPIPGLSVAAWEWLKALAISGVIIGAVVVVYMGGKAALDVFGFESLIGLLLLFLYFAPFVSALISRHPSAGAIGILNILLGWTFVGWVVAAAWAAAVPKRQR